MSAPDRILVIRRDNIGDMVCTTPLIEALRKHYPTAWIGVLTNSYSAPVLDGNPDVDEVLAYRKLKHLGDGESALASLAGRASMLWRLRGKRMSVAIVAAGAKDQRSERLARLLGPESIVTPAVAATGEHEVERTFRAAQMLGIHDVIPPVRVVAQPAATSRALDAVGRAGLGNRHPLVGVHISARRPAQRWPVERFGELVAALSARFGCATILLWSPGPESHPQHPGDDGKAEAIIALAAGKTSLVPYPTATLAHLIGALSICDVVLCSDGGAMHVAAGLGKPIACFFGDSPIARWRPWGVPHSILQAASGPVEGVPVESAIAAIANLLQDRAASTSTL